MTTLTVDQHKQAVALSIKKREDDSWGFKKKCSRQECDNFVGACYCAPTFQEAIVEVQERSNYTCSDRCWLDSGHFLDFLDDYEHDDLSTIADVPEEEVDRILTSLKSPSQGSKWDTLANPTRKAIREWMDDIRQNADYDGDEGECSCEV